MVKKDLEISLTWLLKFILPISMILGGISWGYMSLVVDPRIECKLKPIRRTVIESNFLLQEIVPAEARERVRIKIDKLEELE